MFAALWALGVMRTSSCFGLICSAYIKTLRHLCSQQCVRRGERRAVRYRLLGPFVTDKTESLCDLAFLTVQCCAQADVPNKVLK